MRLAGFIRNLAGDRRGVTAVEFGIVALPLAMLVMGGFDLSHQAYIRAVMQGALTDAARRASVQDPQFTASGSTTQERVNNTIKSQLEAITPGATVTVTESNFYDFSGIGNPEKLMTDVNGNGEYDAADKDCFSDLNENGAYDSDTGRDGIGGANDVAFYRADIDMPRLFPVAGLLGFSPNYQLSVATAVRNQPYGTQKTPPVVCGS
jgi:Flp pilus assembly protein TadG